MTTATPTTRHLDRHRHRRTAITRNWSWIAVPGYVTSPTRTISGNLAEVVIARKMRTRTIARDWTLVIVSRKVGALPTHRATKQHLRATGTVHQVSLLFGKNMLAFV